MDSETPCDAVVILQKWPSRKDGRPNAVGRGMEWAHARGGRQGGGGREHAYKELLARSREPLPRRVSSSTSSAMTRSGESFCVWNLEPLQPLRRPLCLSVDPVKSICGSKFVVPAQLRNVIVMQLLCYRDRRWGLGSAHNAGNGKEGKRDYSLPPGSFLPRPPP